MNDVANTIYQTARDANRPHHLRFARERLATLRAELRDAEDPGMKPSQMFEVLAVLDYAIAQIKAAEGGL